MYSVGIGGAWHLNPSTTSYVSGCIAVHQLLERGYNAMATPVP